MVVVSPEIRKQLRSCPRGWRLEGPGEKNVGSLVMVAPPEARTPLGFAGTLARRASRKGLAG